MEAVGFAWLITAHEQNTIVPSLGIDTTALSVSVDVIVAADTLLVITDEENSHVSGGILYAIRVAGVVEAISESVLSARALEIGKTCVVALIASKTMPLNSNILRDNL